MATLLVDRSSSRCSACGKGCDPHELTHATILTYGPMNGSPGCGARFDSIQAMYMLDGHEDDDMHRLRPDLPAANGCVFGGW